MCDPLKPVEPVTKAVPPDPLATKKRHYETNNWGEAPTEVIVHDIHLREELPADKPFTDKFNGDKLHKRKGA